ncbi:MAG TPA: hypothetical protein VIY68_00960 [Steroidobacteraceae bacterium]
MVGSCFGIGCVLAGQQLWQGSALTLSNGATADFSSGAETLTFTYTVAAGDASTADLKGHRL